MSFGDEFREPRTCAIFIMPGSKPLHNRISQQSFCTIPRSTVNDGTQSQWRFLCPIRSYSTVAMETASWAVHSKVLSLWQRQAPEESQFCYSISST